MRVLLFAAAIAMVVLAGCSSSSDEDTSSSSDDTTMPMHDHSVKNYDVILQGNEFLNGTMTIYQGDGITWKHDDGMTGHSVTSDDNGATFDSHENCVLGALPGPICMASGEEFKFTFKDVGEVAYHCRAHPNMTGMITVIEHPAM